MLTKEQPKERRIAYHRRVDEMRKLRDLQMKAIWKDWQLSIQKVKDEYRAS